MVVLPVDTYQRYWDVSNIKLSSCFTAILKSTSWSRSPLLYQQDCVQDNTKYLSFFYGQTSTTYSKYTYCHNVFAALWKPSCVSYKEKHCRFNMLHWSPCRLLCSSNFVCAFICSSKHILYSCFSFVCYKRCKYKNRQDMFQLFRWYHFSFHNILC